MQHRVPTSWSFLAPAALVAGLVALPAAAAAQTGYARAAQATVGASEGTTTTALADTGTLNSASDAREASQTTGGIGSLVSGDALHAATIGWSDQVASEASIANLAVNILGTTVGADFVMARVRAVQGSRSGSSEIEGLNLNGFPIAVTGERNQRVDIPGGSLIINEQRVSGGGLVVNALHIVVDGVADVVVASAAATR